jgi:alpha-tubulin suppressor-like RCC1 family protein
LGDGSDTSRDNPVALLRGTIPSGATIGKISVGAFHACALASNNAAYCWGNGSQGQLGNSASANLRTPVAVSQGQIPSGVTLTQISAAFNHSCALGSNGAAYCWGYNGQGQLGNDDEGGSDRYVPTAVSQGARPSGVTYTKLSASVAHACAIGSNGWIYCWGANPAYGLGDGTSTNRDVPVAVSGAKVPSGVTFSEVATGWNHTCALGSNSYVYCWGTGFAAGGSSPSAIIEVPTVLPALSGKPEGFSISQLTANWDHTCGLGTDKLVYCWGKNQFFSLGRESDGTAVPGAVLSPVQ